MRLMSCTSPLPPCGLTTASSTNPLSTLRATHQLRHVQVVFLCRPHECCASLLIQPIEHALLCGCVQGGVDAHVSTQRLCVGVCGLANRGNIRVERAGGSGSYLRQGWSCGRNGGLTCSSPKSFSFAARCIRSGTDIFCPMLLQWCRNTRASLAEQQQYFLGAARWVCPRSHTEADRKATGTSTVMMWLHKRLPPGAECVFRGRAVDAN